MTDAAKPATRAAADVPAAALPLTPADEAELDSDALDDDALDDDALDDDALDDDALDDDAPDPDIAEMTEFGPVPVRYRHDGWVPERQQAFIEMLADTGCVDTAARSVGMSRISAYALRRRSDAQAFRLAWDAATDAAITRLADAALARAINGVAVPVFHAGEQIGERREFNERLTMFLLRYRDPLRYGKWRDRMTFSQQEDAPAAILSIRIVRMLRAASRAFLAALHGKPAPPIEREPLAGPDDDEARGPFG